MSFSVVALTICFICYLFRDYKRPVYRAYRGLKGERINKTEQEMIDDPYSQTKFN